MKRCPSCNRTYADETMSFCLADGSLLSAPYHSLREDAPPTELMSPTIGPTVPPTQPAKPPVPTLTNLPSYRGFATKIEDDATPVKNTRPVLWILCAFGAVAITVGVVALLYKTSSRNNNASNSQGTLTHVNEVPNPGADLNSSNNSATPNTIPQPSSTQPEKKIDTLTTDPALFPPKTSHEATTPRPSPEVHYSKVLSGSDVTSKAQILAKPEPVYTEIARQNKITGTVVLRAVFSSGGQVTNIHAVSGLPDGLTERAIEAAKKIRFVPATKDGHPVSMWMQLEYNFNLY